MGSGKLRLLYILQLLEEHTDEKHPLNAAQLSDMLEQKYDISSNRKTIYSDISSLQEFGKPIRQIEGGAGGYYIEGRSFELPELKLLVDAVQSSKFITGSKSEQLIRKLEKLTTRENAAHLQRQVFIFNRPKAGNETIYANVDTIHQAMMSNKMIHFHYCEWTPEKKLVQRKNGAFYEVSPWSLTWDDENYYLVAYSSRDGQIRHYRVDKMQDMELLKKNREGRENFEGFDLAAFSKKTFGMYGGRDVRVSLECENALAGVIIDRFGTDTLMIPTPDGTRFRAQVLVTVSRQFFGWVTSIGEGMRIAGPKEVVAEYEDYLRNILHQYQQ